VFCLLLMISCQSALDIPFIRFETLWACILSVLLVLGLSAVLPHLLGEKYREKMSCWYLTAVVGRRGRDRATYHQLLTSCVTDLPLVTGPVDGLID